MMPGTSRSSVHAGATGCSGWPSGTCLIGLSFGWWVPKHNAHHAHPNQIGRDPDIGEEPRRPRLHRRVPGAAASHGGWHAGRRWLFFPLMLLRRAGLHVLGIKRLFRQRDRASAVEGSADRPACRAVLDGRAVGALPAQGIGLHRRPAGALLAVPGHAASPPTTRACRSSKANGDELRPPPGHHRPKHHRRPVHQLHARRPQLPDRASPIPDDAPAQPATGPGHRQGLLHSDRPRLLRRKLRRVIPPDRPSP